MPPEINRTCSSPVTRCALRAPTTLRAIRRYIERQALDEHGDRSALSAGLVDGRSERCGRSPRSEGKRRSNMNTAVVSPSRHRRSYLGRRVRGMLPVVLIGAGIMAVALATYWIGIGACAPTP